MSSATTFWSSFHVGRAEELFAVKDLRDNTLYFMKMERLETSHSAEREDEISVQVALLERVYPTLGTSPQLLYAYCIRNWDLEGRRCFLMEPFGPSLDALWRYCDHRFAMETCLCITIDLLAGYKHLHQAGFLHNAMNIDAYCIGGRRDNKGNVYIVDFGNVRMYTNDPCARPRQGDARWSSIWADCNLAEEPRSEIMSLALMMIFLLGGDNQAPWMSPDLGWIDQDFDEHHYREAKAKWVGKVAHGHRTKELAPFESMIAYCVNEDGQGQNADHDELITRLERYAKHHRFDLDDKFEWEEHLWEHPVAGRIAAKPLKSLEWAGWV